MKKQSRKSKKSRKKKGDRCSNSNLEERNSKRKKREDTSAKDVEISCAIQRTPESLRLDRHLHDQVHDQVPLPGIDEPSPPEKSPLLLDLESNNKSWSGKAPVKDVDGADALIELSSSK